MSWSKAESDSRVVRAMRDAPIGMCLVAPDGRFVEVNAALCDFFGHDADALVTRTWQEVTVAEDLELDLAQVQRVVDGEIDGYRLTKRFRHSDGSALVGDLSVSGIRDPDGSLAYFVSQIVDVTAKSATELDLAESQHKYRVMVENTSDIVTILSPDAMVVWVSPSVTPTLGWRVDEYAGRSVLEFLHPDELSLMADIQRRAYEGEPKVRIRHRSRCADGTYRWLDTLITIEVDPSDGSPTGYASSRDIDDEVRAQEALRSSRELLRATLDSLQDPWVLLTAIRDGDGVIVDFEYSDANVAACLVNGLSREELIGRRILDLLPEHGPSGLLETYARVIETGVPLKLDDYPFPDSRHPSGIGRFDNRAVKVGDQLSFTWRDVTERYEAREYLAQLAHHDALTGLPNRVRLEQGIQELFQRTPRTGTEIAVLYCDLDAFKAINDTYGHGVGDDVLQVVAARLAGAVRTRDLVARLGGDEFVVVLEGIHDEQQAVAVAEKIRAAVARPMEIEGEIHRTTVSIGIALASHGGDPDGTLRAADAALYRAKNQGRDQVVVLSI